jgi:hypothetical protein
VEVRRHFLPPANCGTAPLKPKDGLNGPPAASVMNLKIEGEGDGWPIQARFWLEWGCSLVTDTGPAGELDCPHALGTDAFSPKRAESFRHVLLLPPPSFAHHGRKPTNL